MTNRPNNISNKTNSANPGKEMKSAIDSGLYCFVTIAKFHGISADPEQIKHSLAVDSDGMREVDIIRASKDLKLKARLATISKKKLDEVPLPAIVQSADGLFFILAKKENDKALVLYPGDNSPRIVSEDDFLSKWNGRVILFVQRIWSQDNQKFGFKWFLPVIRKYKKPLADVLLATLVIQILGLFAPMITQVVIDKALSHNSISTLNVLVIALIAIAVFEAVMGIAKNYIFTQTTSKIDVILGTKLFKHLFSLPLSYFETRRIGDTAARVRELENIRQFLTGPPLTSVIDVLFVVIYIAVMIFYSTQLTFLVIGSLVLYILLSIIVTPLFKKRLDDKFNSGAESQSYLVEMVSGAQTVKSLALEPRMQKKWEGLLANYTRDTYKTAILSGNSGAAGQLIQKITDLAILWLGATLVMAGSLTIGQLIAFRMLSSRVSGPVLRLVQIWQDFQQTGISVKRLGDIFNTKSEPTLDPSKTRLPSITGNIKFEKVKFRYRPDSAEVIRDMTFNITPGTVVGVIGRSGSGKSTISKLMQRMYVPESGKVLIDGVDIALADPAWLRRQIGIVLQENFLFNASIRENIAMQNPAADMNDIVRVAKIAGAHEFILELPEAYDTMVGENGTGLSGGQVQRIAIARALLSNPRILIFDEATSALDYESESVIQKNLKQICKGRTVIIIAHRLSTLKDADKIMSVDKGQIVEYGSQEELMNKKGLYYYLRNQQERGE